MHKSQDKATASRRFAQVLDWAYQNGDKTAPIWTTCPCRQRQARDRQVLGRDQGRRWQAIAQVSRLREMRRKAQGLAREIIRRRWCAYRARRCTARQQRFTCVHDAVRPSVPPPQPSGFPALARPFLPVVRHCCPAWRIACLPGCARRSVAHAGLLLGILISLLVGLASISHTVWVFTRTAWDPVQNEYGGLVMIYGTLMTSAIALLIAVPVSFGIALFLTELSPAWLKRPLGMAIELLAPCPSIVYGMGADGFGPLLATWVQQPHCKGFQRRALPGALVSGPRWALAFCRRASSWRS